MADLKGGNMSLTFTLLIDFLPRFLIAGIITYFFVSKFGKMEILNFERPAFIVPRPDLYSSNGAVSRRSSRKIARSNSGSSRMKTVSVTTIGIGNGAGPRETLNVTMLPPRKKISQRIEFLRELQMILLGVDIWLLLSIALSPAATIYYLLPSLSSAHGTLLYTILAAMLFTALVGAIVSRVRFNTKLLVALMIIASAATIVLYYMPSMTWVNHYSSIFRLILIYSTVLAVCIAVYAMSMLLRRQTAFYLSAYTSIAVYMTSAAILAFNVVATLQL